MEVQNSLSLKYLGPGFGVSPPLYVTLTSQPHQEIGMRTPVLPTSETRGRYSLSKVNIVNSTYL